MPRLTIMVSRIALMASVLLILTVPGQADAAFTITLIQAGNDVVATGTGSLDLTGVLNLGESSIYGPSIRPSVGSITIGAVDFETVYRPYFLNNAGFGAEAYSENATGTGYHVGVLTNINSLYLSSVYVSKTQFTSTATFYNTTIMGLGLTAGTYTYDYSATQGGPVLDTFTIQVGPSGSVPEPSSGLMCAVAGVIGLGIRSARRRFVGTPRD